MVARWGRARVEVARDLSSWELVVPQASSPPQRIQCPPWDIAETRRALAREEIRYLCTTYERENDYHSPLRDCSYYLFRNEVWSASPFYEKWKSEQTEGKDPLLVDHIKDKARALPGSYDGLHWRERDPFLAKEAEDDDGPALVKETKQETARPRRRAHLITIDSNVGARLTPAPWQQAEYLCASALRQFGFDDARVTESGPDGGVDILGSTIAAQVKYTNRPIGRPLVQQLIGAAGGRVTAFFSLAGFSAQATECAGAAAMALFVVRLPCTVIPWNDAARSMSEDMLG